ncbi:kinase-like domain-containing protein, partial [Gautieria morchelliformis]
APTRPPPLPLVLAPIQEYIHRDFDPHALFADLQEVAQGQYGSVYAASVQDPLQNHNRNNNPDTDALDTGADADAALVAVKLVRVPPCGTPKIGQLRRELALMAQVRHRHILGADGLFFAADADAERGNGADGTDGGEEEGKGDGEGAGTLWIRMELMERSLADVLVLSAEGLALEEGAIARFAADASALLALAYLAGLGIAHRDVRSDNLLIGSDGVLKLADFSNGIRVAPHDALCFEIVGVHHWQAPEMRRGHYDASKVDIWSLGATVWECAEGAPPFADVEDTSALGDRWPPLARATALSDAFHEFLRLCSEPPASRPAASQLLRDPFIQQACPRKYILEVLRMCRAIEEGVQQQPDDDGDN